MIRRILRWIAEEKKPVETKPNLPRYRLPDQSTWFHVLPGDTVRTEDFSGRVEYLSTGDHNQRENQAVVLSAKGVAQRIPVSKILEITAQAQGTRAYLNDIIYAESGAFMVQAICRNEERWVYQGVSIDGRAQNDFTDEDIEMVQVFEPNTELKGFRDYQVRRFP